MDFAWRLITLQTHGLLSIGIFPWRSWWLILFAQETINRHYFLFIFLNYKTGREKQVLAKKTHMDLSYLQDCNSRIVLLTCWYDLGGKWRSNFELSDNILLNMDRKCYYKSNFRIRNADWVQWKANGIWTPWAQIRALVLGLFLNFNLILMQ